MDEEHKNFYIEHIIILYIGELEMPITRKLSRRPDGTYRLTLPRSWVELAQKKSGQDVDVVYMEVDKIIKIALDPEHLEEAK